LARTLITKIIVYFSPRTWTCKQPE